MIKVKANFEKWFALEGFFKNLIVPGTIITLSVSKIKIKGILREYVLFTYN
jgi:hypothetical protein